MSSWPPDYIQEYKKRTRLLQACSTDKRKRRALMAHYARNPIDWINDWALTYDPRVPRPRLATMPFKLFPRQEEFIRFLHDCVTEKECGLVEKSRDVGATWLCCAYSVWLLLFVPGSAVGWGSRKAMLVDRLGDPNSIFEKMRMLLGSLPIWMLPAGFDLRRHAPHMKIINPATGATVTGEAGDNIGRGGRSMVYFKDESAHYERPEKIEAALSGNTDVQIDISSVHGTNNVFYRRRMAGEDWVSDKEMPKGKTRVFVFDWRDHPEKTPEWHEEKRTKMESEGLSHIFAQEVDRDYAASLEGIIIPAIWVRASVDADKQLGFGGDGKKIAALDVADEGGDKNAIAIRHGVILKAADHWGQGDTGATARRAVNLARINGCCELYYDSVGVGAGVKAETNRLKEEGILPNTLKVYPWNAAAAPSEPTRHLIQNDPNSPKNEDMFLNLKAQAWWSLRIRFEKTYKAVTQGLRYDPTELISISSDMPLLHEIELELSQATLKLNGSGKIVVDKKPDGGRSPNLADAIVMAFMPIHPKGGGMGLFMLVEEQAAKQQKDL